MKKAIFTAFGGFLLAVLIGLLLVLTGQVRAQASIDDVQLRAYHEGYGVVVEVPIYGDTPTYYTFPFTTGAHDRYKLVDHDVDIDWGNGKSAPIITIDPPFPGDR